MIASQKITAQQMGLAVFNDPQFKLPEKPLFSKHFTLIQHLEDGLIIDGGIEKQLLRGNATKTLIPELIPLMDGNRSIPEIASELPEYELRNVYEAVALLYTRGVIQEGYQVNESDASPYLPYLERFIDGTRINVSAGQALERLRSHTINIISDREKYIKLKEHFLQYGVEVDDWDYAEQSADSSQVTLLVLDHIDDLYDHKVTMKKLASKKVPCFVAILQGSTLITGPYIDTENTMCFECFLEQLERIPVSTETDDSVGVSRLKDAGLGYVAAELTNFLSRVSSLLITQNMVNVVDLKTWASNQIKFSKVPYCIGCDGVDDKDPVIDIVSQYESFVSFPPREFISIKDHQNHYRPKNLELARFFKEFHSFPFIQLEKESSLPTAQELKEGKAADLRKLAKILLFSNGLKTASTQRPNQVNRYAPTGGNLGSVDMYFLNKGIKGLEQAVYFYDPLKQGLYQITEKLDQSILAEAIADKDKIQAEFSKHLGYFVLAGSYEKVAQKYKEFGYRIVHLDAGVAFTHIKASSEATGLSVLETDRYIDDHLMQLLKFNRRKEIITYLIAVGKGSELDE
jgi:SagB-type dehydrogenase family enzyme